MRLGALKVSENFLRITNKQTNKQTKAKILRYKSLEISPLPKKERKKERTTEKYKQNFYLKIN